MEEMILKCDCHPRRYSGRADEVITESSPHVRYREGPVSAMMISCMTEVLIMGVSVMVL